MNDKVVITCALTGVLTDPKQHPVPVTPAEMAREARAAFDAGAAVMHVHFRQQAPGKGHLPSWDPQLAATIMQAIRDACPNVILNQFDGHGRIGHFWPACLPARRQARDGGVQRRFAQLSESAFGWLLGVAAAFVRQSGRKG